MDVDHLIDILDNSEYAIISLDPKFDVTFLSKKAEELLDVERDFAIGKKAPFRIDANFLADNTPRLLSSGRVPISEIILSDGKIVAVSGYITAIFSGNGQIKGLSFHLKRDGYLLTRDGTSSPGISNPCELSDFPRKRTFQNIRMMILSTLLSRRKTINQIAKDIGVNWKTVEKHLTFLSGKKYIEEVFSSKYVRIFEISESGRLHFQKSDSSFNEPAETFADYSEKRPKSSESFPLSQDIPDAQLDNSSGIMNKEVERE